MLGTGLPEAERGIKSPLLSLEHPGLSWVWAMVGQHAVPYRQLAVATRTLHASSLAWICGVIALRLPRARDCGVLIHVHKANRSEEALQVNHRLRGRHQSLTVTLSTCSSLEWNLGRYWATPRGIA